MARWGGGISLAKFREKEKGGSRHDAGFREKKRFLSENLLVGGEGVWDVGGWVGRWVGFDGDGMGMGMGMGRGGGRFGLNFLRSLLVGFFFLLLPRGGRRRHRYR